MSNDKQKEIEKSLLAQDDQLKKADDRIDELKDLSDELNQSQNENSDNINKIDNEIDELFNELGIDDSKIDLDKKNKDFELSKEELKKIENQLPDFNDLEIIKANNWEGYQDNLQQYIKDNKIDDSKDPLSVILTPEQIKNIESKYKEKFGDITWNKWDFGIVGIASVIAFLLDVLLVKTPNSGFKPSLNPKNKIGGKINENSKITEYIEKITGKLNPDNNKIIKKIEDKAKVPYDPSISNSPNFDLENTRSIKEDATYSTTDHRLKSLGHDPLLGLIFGVLDCFRGTFTVFTNAGEILVKNNKKYQSTNIFVAIIKTLAHFISDIGTKSSLPAPLFNITQAITKEVPVNINEKNGTEKLPLNKVAAKMYRNGYNFNHFLTMSIVPGVIEIIIRAYNWLLNPTMSKVGNKLKTSTMLTVAHSLSSAGNLLKVYLSGWNPMAFNWAQFLFLGKSIFSMKKYRDERNNYIQNELYKNMNQIYAGKFV